MPSRVLFLSRATLFSGPGGDTVQMTQTAAQLRRLGWQVDITTADQVIDYGAYDLFHFFNVIRPADLLPHVHRSKRPYVVSPVFMDYSGYEAKHRRGLLGQLMRRLSPDGQEYVKTLARWVRNGERVADASYLWRGHRAAVREVLAGAAAVLPNSPNEQRRLELRYGVSWPTTVVPNGIDLDAISQAARQPDSRYAGAIVCAARIEGNKNQLALIQAVRDLPIRLVLTGQPAPNHAAYAAECRAQAGANVEFLGRLPEHLDVLRILATARLHVLPSHFETCGLSSLEAAALGVPIVVGERGDVRDYFGHHATYCDPDSVESIRQAILTALDTGPSEALRQRIFSDFTWVRAAEITAEVYQRVLSGRA